MNKDKGDWYKKIKDKYKNRKKEDNKSESATNDKLKPFQAN